MDDELKQLYVQIETLREKAMKYGKDKMAPHAVDSKEELAKCVLDMHGLSRALVMAGHSLINVAVELDRKSKE